MTLNETDFWSIWKCLLFPFHSFISCDTEYASKLQSVTGLPTDHCDTNAGATTVYFNPPFSLQTTMSMNKTL